MRFCSYLHHFKFNQDIAIVLHDTVTEKNIWLDACSRTSWFTRRRFLKTFSVCKGIWGLSILVLLLSHVLKGDVNDHNAMSHSVVNWMSGFLRILSFLYRKIYMRQCLFLFLWSGGSLAREERGPWFRSWLGKYFSSKY